MRDVEAAFIELELRITEADAWIKFFMIFLCFFFMLNHK